VLSLPTIVALGFAAIGAAWAFALWDWCALCGRILGGAP
jgi:hypothetical protein